MRQKKIAIVQSNYLPWKGYFDLIAAVDEFILYDDMQYTRRDWRNRNQIKTPEGVAWITVPVNVKGKYEQTIRETQIDGDAWKSQHLKSFAFNYKKAPYYAEIMALIEPLFAQEHTHLSQLNRVCIEAVCNYLGIATKISNSWDYRLADGKSERLAELCISAGGSEYLSGPAAMGYLDAQVFQARNLTLTWFDYQNYPEYPQLWGAFTHNVTILDLLFNCGKNAPAFMKHGRP